MRSILEKAFVALLNEEQDKAEELFHKFMVERARQIHESYRNGDEFDMDECWEDEIHEETHFSEDDLSDLEDDDMESGEDDHVDGDDMIDGDDYAADEEGDEHTDDMSDEEGDESEEMSDEERIDNLEDQIEKLTAEFEAMMDAIGDDDSEEEESEDSDDMDSDEVEDFNDEDMETPPEDDMDDGEEKEEDHMEESEDMDDMDDLTESIIDELEKVKVSLEDGKEIGTGSKIGQNLGAAIPQKNKEARMGGEPIKMKSAEHKGYARETAPATTDMPKRRNTRSPATSGMDKVSKEGNKSAEINKLSSESGNTTSPLQGTKNVVK